jgi:sugar phosphate isomerase/epimerase
MTQRKTARLDRREFGVAACAALAGATICGQASVGFETAPESGAEIWRPRYMLASSLYGKTDVREVLAEAERIGTKYVDLWPLPHGNQREQIDEMGLEAFAALLDERGLKIGALTRYDLGPLRLEKEFEVARELGAPYIVCGSTSGAGPKGGEDLKRAVRDFAEKLKPHLARAGEYGVQIAIETHGSMLICSPDSVRWLVELTRDLPLAIALAPYHLPQDSELLAALIAELGERMAIFYAWQYGKGCMEPLPKEDELLQLPGRGGLDFGPAMAAMAKGGYRGFVEVFMHPVPRGIPILPTPREVTSAIEASQRHLNELAP